MLQPKLRHHCPKLILKNFTSFTKTTKNNKEIENVIARMQKEICSKSSTINSSIADDIEEVVNKNLNVSQFMKLFWEQQKSSQNKGSVVRY